jgi:hypothetical protein
MLKWLPLGRKERGRENDSDFSILHTGVLFSSINFNNHIIFICCLYLQTKKQHTAHTQKTTIVKY